MKLLIPIVAMTTFCFSSNKTLDTFIDELNRNPKLEGMSIGVSIKDSEKTYLSYNAKKLLRPVSTIKLLSTALAFEHLSLKNPFSTKLGHTNEISEGILKGDLVLQGQSDPTLGSDRFGGIEKVFEEFYQPLKYLELKKIEGNLVVDASLFEKAQTPASWLYEDLANYYGAGATSLNIHENSYGIFFRLGRQVGDEAKLLKVSPKVKNLKITSFVTTNEKGTGDQAYIFGKEYSNDHVIRGSLPQGQSTYKIRGSLPNPPLFFLENFYEYLKGKGISISGKLIVNYDKKDQKINWLYTNKSASLQKIATLALKHSINLYSEALLKRTALESYNFGSTDNGLKAFNEFISKLNVGNNQYSIYDASGVSMKSLITPDSFTSALEELKNQSYFDSFLQSISKASNYRAFSNLDDSLKERVYLKTGSSSQFLCFAGYIRSNSGKLISYSLMCNNCEKNRSEVFSLAKELFHVASKL